MGSDRRCPNCQAPLAPQATFCRACKTSIPAAPKASGAPTRSSQAPTVAGVTMLPPAARRSLVVQRLSVSAALSGLVSLLFALPAIPSGDLGMAVFAGGFAAAFLSASYFGRVCHPLGRPLLLGYSAFLLLGFPVGTIQGIFQILHLLKPEAKLIFEGRDRFSAAEARQITAFKAANPWLASWLRLVNFLAIVLMVGLVAAVTIPMFAK